MIDLESAFKEAIKLQLLRYAQIMAVALLCATNLALESWFGAVILKWYDMPSHTDGMNTAFALTGLANLVAIAVLMSRGTSPGHLSEFFRWPLHEQCLYSILLSLVLGAIIGMTCIAIDVFPQVL